jgi:UDP-N-acetylglucosamine 2-epimerase (non-hydrolysing)
MILFAYGTRPELIKIKPILDKFKENNIEHRVLFTGQHEDLLDIIPVDYQLAIIDGYNCHNRLDCIIEAAMNRKNIWKDITHVLVQGDTTSVLAVALAAFHRNIKVIHLEAGLRTYDKFNPYPEEINRRIVSQLADIHLCPTQLNKKNLENEKIEGEKYIVGNTILDNLINYKKDCEYKDKILITMHRRENHHWLDRWFKEINKLADLHFDLEFIIPLHPNPNVQKHKHLLNNVNVINPLSHEELIKLLIQSKIVITDSGGLQEECSFFNKKCLTCRKVTERPEAIGQSTIMIDNPDQLKTKFNQHIMEYEINYNSPFGDGYSAKRILEIIKKI